MSLKYKPNRNPGCVKWPSACKRGLKAYSNKGILKERREAGCGKTWLPAVFLFELIRFGPGRSQSAKKARMDPSASETESTTSFAITASSPMERSIFSCFGALMESFSKPLDSSAASMSAE